MIWAGIQKTSTIDYPGVLSCVLFSAGCDLNCFYCHNRDIIHEVKNTISEDEIMSFLNKRKGLLDGVVVTGGEPTIQPDLSDFIKTLKSMRYKVKLDSNGQHANVVKNLLDENLLDYVAIDIKALPEDYESVCDVNGFDKLKETLEVLSNANVKYEVRTTLYPTMTIKDLKKLFGLLPSMPLWRLNFYNMPEVYDDSELERLQAKALNKINIDDSILELKALQPNLVY